MTFIPAHRRKKDPFKRAKLAPYVRRRGPLPKLKTCGHCGRADVGSYGAGSASVTDAEFDVTPLCHPNETGRPDCYRLVTVYHHPMPCNCAPTRSEGASQ